MKSAAFSFSIGHIGGRSVAPAMSMAHAMYTVPLCDATRIRVGKYCYSIQSMSHSGSRSTRPPSQLASSIAHKRPHWEKVSGAEERSNAVPARSLSAIHHEDVGVEPIQEISRRKGFKDTTLQCLSPNRRSTLLLKKTEKAVSSLF
jgi:hypothetical protein